MCGSDHALQGKGAASVVRCLGCVQTLVMRWQGASAPLVWLVTTSQLDGAERFRVHRSLILSVSGCCTDPLQQSHGLTHGGGKLSCLVARL